MKKSKIVPILSWSLLIVGIALIFLYFTLGVFSILLSIIFFIIAYYQNKISSDKSTREHEKIIELIQESAGSNKKLEGLKNLLKKENIDVRKTISRFDSPVWSIFIYKFGKQPRYSKIKLPKKLLEHLTKNLKFEIVGNSFYFLPPNKMPKIRSNFDIEKWTNKNIVRKISNKIPYNIKWIALVDLRKVFVYKTTDYGETIFDILLKKDKLFLERFINSLKSKNIPFSQIAKDWELSDIITIKIDKKLLLKTRLEEILKMQISSDILDNIIGNCKALREIQ